MEGIEIPSPEDDKKKSARQMFTPEEDKQLIELVKEFGDRNWRMISKKMEKRTTRQCRERYRNYLSPNLTNGPWTAEEDLLLEQKYVELGPKWAAIAQFFKNRSDVNIKNRWASNRHKAMRMTPKNLVDNLIIPKKQFLNAIQNIFPLKTLTLENANAIFSSLAQAASPNSSPSSTNSLTLQQLQLQQQKEFLLFCAAPNKNSKSSNIFTSKNAKSTRNSAPSPVSLANLSPQSSSLFTPSYSSFLNFVPDDPLLSDVVSFEKDLQLANIDSKYALPTNLSCFDDFEVQPLFSDVDNYKLFI